MICPHCDENLRQRERTGRTCSRCGREFVLDPRTNPLRLSDVRIQRVAAKLTEAGRTRITVAQLWYALSRKQRGEKGNKAGAIGCLALGLPVGLTLTVTGLAADGVGILALFGFLILFFLLVSVPSMLRGGERAVEAYPLSRFRGSAMNEWIRVHGSLPSGVIDERTIAHPAQPASPTGVLLCGDASIAAFLVANEIPRRFGTAVVTRAHQVAAGPQPVIVLHDADAAGCQLAARTRVALPGRRVVDAGLPPRAVMNAPAGVAVKGGSPAAEAVQRLRAAGTLTEAEVGWLEKGMTGPLGAVPPGKLLTVVTRVIERVTGARDADVAEAEAVGFLTWPTGEATP
ncbi:hypothetical protein AB0O07_15955 [Streptomyces sp. NPDC093085]|uniref:hypothetical protein n=1 Tax=Streptomyces sp. NPDC093085 TaxID=3155068 RepID=UPI003447B3D2